MYRVLFIIASLPVAFAQSEGVAAEWDIRKTLADLAAQTEQLKPLVAQINPGDWIAKGAPETYRAQHKTAQDQTAYLARIAAELSRQPERLPLAIETCFRIESATAFMNSLLEGVNRYQSPELASRIRGVLTASLNHREKLKQYALDLSSVREKEFVIVDREAQRCRERIVKEPRPK